MSVWKDFPSRYAQAGAHHAPERRGSQPSTLMRSGTRRRKSERPSINLPSCWTVVKEPRWSHEVTYIFVLVRRFSEGKDEGLFTVIQCRFEWAATPLFLKGSRFRAD